MEKLGIKERTTNSGHYYKVLGELDDKKHIIVRYKYAVKQETLIYILEYEDEVFTEWDLHKKRIKIERDKIECGFALIEQGVISQMKGGLVSFVGDYPLIEKWPHTGVLNSLVRVEDDSDFLFLSVKNQNAYPIEGVGVKIIFPYLFYEIGSCKLQKNCSYDIDYITVFVNCNRLLPGMQAQLLFELQPTKHNVSFKNKEVEEKYIMEEKVPTVNGWYKNVPIRVKGGKVTADMPKGVQTVTIDEDEVLTFEFDA